MSNTLTGLIPTIYTARTAYPVSRWAYPAVARNAKADAAAKDQTVTAPVAPKPPPLISLRRQPRQTTVIRNIGTVDVKITKSKMPGQMEW
ncbi:hypothetical protein ACVXG7_09380 [Enterobacter hormaechei]